MKVKNNNTKTLSQFIDEQFGEKGTGLSVLNLIMATRPLN